jgi:hypothetical protein
LDGNIYTNAEGEPLNADYKHLANLIYSSSYQELNMQVLDKLELAQKINKGEEVDLEEREQDLIKDFISSLAATKASHISSWLKCFDKPKKS